MNPGSLTTHRIARRALWCVLVLCMLVRVAHGQTQQSFTQPLISPSSIVFDSGGRLYLAEAGRHVVDRLDATGALVPVAGSGTQGFAGDGGPAATAQLDSPQGIALDSAGNLYIADTHNHRVRRVAAATGIITTIAGTGASGFGGDGGLATSARLCLPRALTLDQAGNLYVADTGNQRVRKIALATGAVTTVAGNGTQGSAGDLGLATAAALDMPSGLAVNAAGDLYLADFHNQRVRRVAHDTGVISTLAPGTPIRLPRGLSLDAAGNVYVAETGGHRILRLAGDGTATVMAGTGAEGFAGDNGPATMALLDGPQGTGISPAGLVTLADTRNQRIRQVDAAGVIHTLGATAVTPSSLALAGPATVQYGGGTLTATLSATTAASGNISFFEAVNGTETLLGTATLASNAAPFSAANLAAGTHMVQATFPGDALHGAASSNIFLLNVSQTPVVATPVAATVLYGQTIPPLAGSISGVLPRDMTFVSAVFGTAARALSPVGAYPIGALLTGASAANYQVTVTPASLTIQQAPTATTVAASAGPVAAGTAVTLSARAATTTQGVPTGRITFLDGGAVLGSATADAAGGVALTTSGLTVGSHTLTAVYGGDGNFLGSTSGAITEVVSPVAGSSPDFTIAVAGGASQSAAAGATVSFGFNVAVQNGPLNSPIVLAASGMPPGGTATFSPAYLPPGGAVSAFTLTVQTTKTVAGGGLELVSFGLLVLGAALLSGRRGRRGLGLVVLAASVAGLGGCGGIQGTQLPGKTTSALSYPMTVTATSTLPNGTTLQRTAVVTLIVQ